ncbi:deoxynucleotidyltransferase terminal interacting protein 2 [Phyllostomus discolor]|uniref:Deoxynucleotidyltransferase terminal-interacting protein 2 n=3 Tax=Phyllostomus discolor TaxID=89673 RepID=A0A6J2LLX5_9CHIR|nr:deoxynucleotidyltransferase terminal-interacting protein 2 [Phyllostomus discolor]KAF6108306.1 deoxynucleotidyltransferase terminal interacting protein 2 [Phyllostomus discolor]
MVLTRSARPQARIQATTAESSGQKNSAERVQEHLKGRKESPSDDQNTAESQSNRKSSLIPKTPETGKRKSRTAGSLPEMNKPSTDGETSEAESNCSVFELQDSILRVTRRRQILVARDPLSSAKKRLKVTPISESHTEEEVSEAESHVSGISRIVPSTRTRRSKAKSLTDPSQDSHAEAISDAESSCSDISTFSRVATRRTTGIMQRKLPAQMEEKDTKIIPGNEKQMINTPMDSEDSDARQTSHLRARSLPQINKPNFSNNEIYSDFDDSFHEKSGKKSTVQEHQHLNKTEEKQVNVAPLKEITKQSYKSLDEEAKGMIDKEKEINEKNSEVSFSELQENSLPQLVSQRHSTPHNKKTTSRPSNQNCEAIMKSLAQTFAVVEIDRWTEERKSTVKTSDFTSSNGDGSDEEECTVIAASEDVNKERDVDFDCDTELYKSEPTSQDTGDSVLLLLSSDESQQSENSEIEEDTVCFVENSAQRGSLNGDLGNKSCDNALFVIDTTPGLSAGKNFYLGEEDKADEGAIEEEKEGQEEDEKSEDEPSDEDKNKDDEFSDEDDLLNDTKSKLLKLTSSSIDTGLSIKQLGGLYINFNADKLQSNKKTLTQIKEKKKNEIMQKAIITPDFEKNYCVPPYRESKYQLQKKRRKERQKTAGDGWFGMKAPELTDELKNDLKALKMRAGMDPKRFYKKNDRDGFPKYFQIGTIVDNPADFYHSRIPKKQRKKTIVEELLADSEFRRYNRRKYSEIMAEKVANAAGKKFRKKKKFRN